MNPRAARFLTRLYPPAWRARFGEEFQTFLESRRVSAWETLNIASRAVAEQVVSHLKTTRRRLILTFSLLIGVIWMAQILFGNLADTPLLGNYRTGHQHTYRAMGWTLISIAVALTAAAGFAAAYRLGRLREALTVAVWSGFLSGAIALVTLMGMEVVFHNTLIQSPSVLSEFARVSEAGCQYMTAQDCLTWFMYSDALAGGMNMLWVGALLGITAGSIGAGLGMLARKTAFPAI